MDLTEIGWCSLGCIHLAQDRHQWRSPVNTAWTFGFHKMLANSWVAELMAACHEWLSYIELVS
jgi:hypothetical protein